VLPFENLSGDPQQAYIGDGIADDLITALSHLRGIALLALYLPYVGRTQEALDHIRKAWRLSPFPEDWYFDALGAAYYGAGGSDEAIAAWNECRRRMPDYLWCRVTLTFAYVKTGHETEA
jgi:tetratricopeptide (TPR) repeat protein